jgi:WhiB family transcriptional regulator, redox-sensing transcriptional regulator
MQLKGTSVPTAEPVTNWRRRSSCLEADPELFFGPDEESAEARQVRESAASAVCLTCPVLAQCATWSLSIAIPYGVWGGQGEGERAEILAGGLAALPGRSSRDLVEVAS